MSLSAAPPWSGFHHALLAGCIGICNYPGWCITLYTHTHTLKLQPIYALTIVSVDVEIQRMYGVHALAGPSLMPTGGVHAKRRNIVDVHIAGGHLVSLDVSWNGSEATSLAVA